MMESHESQHTVLVVDDNPTNLEVMIELLEGDGLEVLVALDGAGALEQAELVAPDLILLDVMLPGLDGFETCQRLKQVEALREIPIIFMTALSAISDKVRGFNLGAVDYITKPLQHQEVLSRVRTHLTLRELQRRLVRANEDLERRVQERTEALARANATLAAENRERLQANRELQATNRAFERFVPLQFLQLLSRARATEVALGDQVQLSMTVLFSDIRSFTQLSESMSPADSFAFINDYLRCISPVIREHNGFIDKYIGDGIMALFPGEAADALDAAIAMRAALDRFNAEAVSRPQIEAGIGIHTGELMLGIVGEEERLQGTVISDAVNLAARLETLTKRYKTPVVISGQTLTAVEHAERYDCRLLDEVRVKGKREEVAVFELRCPGPERHAIATARPPVRATPRQTVEHRPEPSSALESHPWMVL
ncbi:MAG: response regulator [Myxococcales bacterium]|nr:response regulator [Myxococcales bacterium]